MKILRETLTECEIEFIKFEISFMYEYNSSTIIEDIEYHYNIISIGNKFTFTSKLDSNDNIFKLIYYFNYVFSGFDNTCTKEIIKFKLQNRRDKINKIHNNF
jgi:hypothetical protein